MANYSCKKFPLYDLTLIHNTSVTDAQTTTMPIARPLLMYGRLITTGNPPSFTTAVFDISYAC